MNERANFYKDTKNLRPRRVNPVALQETVELIENKIRQVSDIQMFYKRAEFNQRTRQDWDHADQSHDHVERMGKAIHRLDHAKRMYLHDAEKLTFPKIPEWVSSRLGAPKLKHNGHKPEAFRGHILLTENHPIQLHPEPPKGA